MQPLDSGTARLTRAVLLSGGIVVLAAAAHVLAHGVVPSLAAAVLAAAVSLPLTILMTGRRLALPWVVVVMGVGQLVLHQFFEFSAACATGAASGGLGHLGHAGHAGSFVAGGALTCAHAEHAASSMSGLMLALHGVATVLTALVVVGADRALWDLLARVLCRIPALLPLDVPRPVGVLLCRTRVAAPAMHLRRHPTHRGPPRVSATWA